jgi:hypothetical protein
MVAVAKATVEVMAALAVVASPPSQAALTIAAVLQVLHGLPTLTARSSPMA